MGELSEPVVGRPDMPEGYGLSDPQYGFTPLKWSWVTERMAAAQNYWVASVTGAGGPHVAPVWGIWHDDAFYFGTDRGSLKARNLLGDPRAVVHLESGDEVVVLRGEMKAVADSPEFKSVAETYEAKYDVPLDASNDGVTVFVLSHKTAMAWLESDFPKTATRWKF